jgi:dihydropyrimidine dehydrogenase (NAD+) subunit PreA
MDNCITMVRKDDGKDSTTWKERADQGKIPTTFNDQLAGGVAHHIPEPKEALYKKKRS